MPIQIRELYIKAVIDGGGKKGNPDQSGGAPAANAASGAPDAAELIDVCVEKVLEILKDKKER